MDIEEIKKRHEFDAKHAIKVVINWDEFAFREPWIAERIRASGMEQELLKDVNGTLQERHQDRSVLLKRIAELSKELDKAQGRIFDLEEEVERLACEYDRDAG